MPVFVFRLSRLPLGGLTAVNLGLPVELVESVEGDDTVGGGVGLSIELLERED